MWYIRLYADWYWSWPSVALNPGRVAIEKIVSIERSSSTPGRPAMRCNEVILESKKPDWTYHNYLQKLESKNHYLKTTKMEQVTKLFKLNCQIGNRQQDETSKNWKKDERKTKFNMRTSRLRAASSIHKRPSRKVYRIRTPRSPLLTNCDVSKLRAPTISGSNENFVELQGVWKLTDQFKDLVGRLLYRLTRNCSSKWRDTFSSDIKTINILDRSLVWAFVNAQNDLIIGGLAWCRFKNEKNALTGPKIVWSICQAGPASNTAIIKPAGPCPTLFISYWLACWSSTLLKSYPAFQICH